jgi:hypothetical protein
MSIRQNWLRLLLAGCLCASMIGCETNKVTEPELHTLTVTLAGAGGGTVASSPTGINCGTSCTGEYPAGTLLTLTATPSSGSVFEGWGGACSGTGSTCQVTMDGARTVTATFSLQTFPLTVVKAGTGNGRVTSSPSGIDCGETCAGDVTSGTEVTLTATAASGSVFAGWSGACTGTASTCQVTMDGAKEVEATFGLQLYTLSVTKAGSGSGTVTSSPAGIDCGEACAADFTSGSNVTLTATAASGSAFGGWSGACTGNETTCVLTMDAAKEATSTFNLLEPPQVIITSPEDGATFFRGEGITLAGSATDGRGNPLPVEALAWTSSLDGALGTGRTFIRNNLAVGNHTITLVATDSMGLSGSTSVGILIEPPPGTVALGDTVSGSIEVPGDIDEFTFWAQAGQEVAIFIQGRSGSYWDRFNLYLLDPARNQLGSAQSRGNDVTLTDGTAGQSTGRISLTHSGIYTVLVRGSNSTTDSGPYRFYVHPVDRAPEHVSAAIALGDTIQGEDIYPPSDIDEFTFQAQAGQEVAIFIQGRSGSYWDRFNLYLLDPARNQLGYAQSYGNDATLTDGAARQSTGRITLTHSGTHTVLVRGSNSTTDSGPYRFYVHPVDLAPEHVSAAIALGDTIQGEDIYPPSDIDEFTFQAQAGQEVAIFIQGRSGSYWDRFNLYLLDPARNQLGYAQSYGNDATLTDGASRQSTGRITLTHSGTYTVLVRGNNSTTDSGPYRFHPRLLSGG